MKVYFKQNFWSKVEDGIPGIPKSLNWKFTYDNVEYFIPTVYYFSEGITIDILSFIDNEKFKMFYDKYAPIESELNDEDILFAEQERPIPELPLGSIYINEQLVETSRCASSYISFFRNDKKEKLSEIKEAYKISDEQSFYCTRVHAKYCTQREIDELKIVTNRTEELLKIRKHFTLNIVEAKNQNDIVFKHPLTNVEHHIYVNDIKLYDARNDFPHHDHNAPSNFAIIEYEIFPALSSDERLIINEIEQEDIKGNYEKGKHGQKLEYTFTSKYWKRLKNIEFSITGIYKTKSMEKELIFNIIG